MSQHRWVDGVIMQVAGCDRKMEDALAQSGLVNSFLGIA